MIKNKNKSKFIKTPHFKYKFNIYKKGIILSDNWYDLIYRWLTGKYTVKYDKDKHKNKT